VKVVLTGEGSDELFGGYGRYRFQLLNQACMKYYGAAPQAARRWVQRAIAGSKLMSGNLRRKLQHTFLARGGEVESIYLDNFYSAFPAADQGEFFRGLETGRTYTNYLRYWNEAAARSFLGRMLYADQKTYLVELLMKQDQMSMACSIESRVPFLDHPLVEFSTRVPDRLKIRNGTGKYILKKAVEDLLPAEILHRKKMGFPTPLKPWLAGDGAQMLLGQLQRKDGLLAGYVNRAELERLLDRHRAGSEDATDRIWRLLNLQVWADVFLEGRRNAVWEGLLPGDGG
jgi:asparagine synthase (glutamine-hydrolysing)